MKKHFILAIILTIASVCVAFSAQPNWPTQGGEPVQCNFGFKSVATPTIALDAADTINLLDYLPAETIGFELRAATGSFIIGHPDNIATGTSRIGRLVPQGTTYVWNGLAGSFNGSIMCDADNTVIVIDAVWGQYEP